VGRQEPEFVSPGDRLVGALFGRRARRPSAKPLDDGSVLDVRCPRCSAALRARCGRTNACPRCGEQVLVPGADVARAIMPTVGRDLAVHAKSNDHAGTPTVLPGPLLVLDYQRPWYLVRVRGTQTGWVAEESTRLIAPIKPARTAR
jgi:DNA-directed RNA polymerase subunit RPC12/RpoP